MPVSARLSSHAIEGRLSLVDKRLLFLVLGLAATVAGAAAGMMAGREPGPAEYRPTLSRGGPQANPAEGEWPCVIGGREASTMTELKAAFAPDPMPFPAHSSANKDLISHGWTCGRGNVRIVFTTGIIVDVTPSELSDPTGFFAKRMSKSPLTIESRRIAGYPAEVFYASGKARASGGGRVWMVRRGLNIMISDDNHTASELADIASTVREQS